MQYEHDELLAKAQDFIDLMKKSGLGYFRIKNDKFEIELGEKAPAGAPPMPPMTGMPPMQPGAPCAAPDSAASTQPQAEKPGYIVRSPIIGTFYAAPSPDKPPFVSAGKTVHSGDVLFIIESMKLMNEVTSDCEGIVDEIFVCNGDTVEYDQPIMRII